MELLYNLVNNNFDSSDEIIKSFKTIIKGALYPKNPTYYSVGSMVIAKKALKTYIKSNGSINGLIDLMLFYVECGTQFTLDYGDIDEGYYETLENTFEELLQLLKENSISIDSYKNRFYSILYESRDIGWGYADQLQDLIDMYFPHFLKDNPIN